ncbi:MAG: hypothetical protein JXQ29_13720 [Planctomycetes bacterium]|nr:hypothetical protein [Planctomycetota bacterium]
MGRIAAILALGFALLTPAVRAQREPKGRFTDYPVKPYCTECLKRKMLGAEEKERPIRLMQFDGKDVLDFIGSRHLILIETEDFKLVSTVPGDRFAPGTSPRLALELPMLRERFPQIGGSKLPKLDRHQIAHLFALHMHRVKLEFWELFETRASSYSGIMNRKNKHEIYLFGSQREYDRFTDRFTGLQARAGQEIILHQDDAVGFVRPPPPSPGLDTWNNTIIHMWVHLLLECQVRNAYNRPAWLDAGFAHWWERRESDAINTFCFSESREVGNFGSGDWRPRVRRLVESGKAPDFANFADVTEISSIGNLEHGLAFSMVDYILEHKKKELRDYVGRLGAAERIDQSAVFRAAFKMSIPAFDEEWREWVRKTYSLR